MELRIFKCCFLVLLVVVYCLPNLALERKERLTTHSNADRSVESSSHLSQYEQRIRFPRRLSSRHNELASTEPADKDLHMLIGRHLKNESTFPLETINVTKHTENTMLDDGLLLSSAGNGKERKSSTKPSESTSSDDDDKKTLSQQVKEGKYGLIQNEIYPAKPKRPGIISYSSNPEVPGDNIKNLGGLDEEEIWLAENHVLVLKGGSFPDSDTLTESSDSSKWPPIDDYKAPSRQVKIPPKPKVPPPFPVQLIEGGPVQLIGTNVTTLAENSTIDIELLPGGFKGFLPGEGPYFPFSTVNNNTTDTMSNIQGSPEKKNKAEGAPGTFYPALPPGAVIVPPPSNQTDYDDEDQSIYYPPPYSFIYSQDNSTAIPPGPLVPGIILPPPPDFFSSLDEKKPTIKNKFSKRPSTTPDTSVRSSYLPPRKSSTKLYKTSPVTSLPIISKTASYSPKPFSRSKLKNSTYNRYHAIKLPTRAYQTVPFAETTSSTPIKPRILDSPKKFHIVANEVTDSSREKIPWNNEVVSSRAIPLVTFFATTTSSSIEQPVETTPSTIKNILTTENPTHYPRQTSYYFYEETNNEETPSSTVSPVTFFGTTTETPSYYKLELKEQQQQKEEKKQDYDVEMIPSQQTSKDYNVKLIDTTNNDTQIYHYLDSGATSNQEKLETSPVKNQSPRLLQSEPLYYQPVPTRTPPKLRYFTMLKPKTYYRRPKISENYEYSKSTSKPKPIYQYSFEATNYAKRQEQPLTQLPEIREQEHQIQPSRRQKELPLYTEYQDIENINNQYDYDGSVEVVDQHVQEEKLPYTNSKKKEEIYYQQPITVSPIRETTLASHQQFFTKQDEQLLDDVTKEYFTMFGKKLPGKLPSTTPIYGKSSVTEKPKFNSVNSFDLNEYSARQPSSFRAQNIKVHYGDQTPGPFSFKDDIIINFKQPLPPINPDSEFISVINPRPQPAALTQKFRPRPVIQIRAGNQVRDYPLPVNTNTKSRYDLIHNYGTQKLEQLQQQQLTSQREPTSFVPISDPRETIRGDSYLTRPISLEGDIAVNYKHSGPSINTDTEFINGGLSSRLENSGEKTNSYFAYRLPGDGGHFYFLTPQAISREDSNTEYMYSRSRGSRLLDRRSSRRND